MENKQDVVKRINLTDDEEILCSCESCYDELNREIKERRHARGRVRWYHNRLGYGFIQEDGFSEDIFVHKSSIQVPGARILRDGQRVLFDICKNRENKIVAIDVVPILERSEALEKYHAMHKDST